MVEIHDERMLMGHTLQAELRFPIDCPIDLHYYSSSYFSINDAIPWMAYFCVENSNIKVGSNFTKMKGLLKLWAARKANYVTFREPMV